MKSYPSFCFFILLLSRTQVINTDNPDNPDNPGNPDNPTTENLSGKGTESDPYLIKTAQDLYNLRNYTWEEYKGSHFSIVNDIDLTAFLKGKEQGWEPVIGFYGNLNGNGQNYGNIF